jgi:hypothetical protein
VLRYFYTDSASKDIAIFRGKFVRDFSPIIFGIIVIVMTGSHIESARADENIFCGNDAATLLGDVCVDSQGRVPDNADIREAIVDRCDGASDFVNKQRSVVGFFNAFYGEYGFCTRSVTDNGNRIYYLKFGYENNIVHWYNTTTESWGRLNIWKYSTQTRYLLGRLVTFTKHGRSLPTPSIKNIEMRDMSQNLAALLVIQNVNPVTLKDIQRSSTRSNKF